MMWVPGEVRNQFFRFFKKITSQTHTMEKKIVSIVLEIALFWYILDFSIVHFTSI